MRRKKNYSIMMILIIMLMLLSPVSKANAAIEHTEKNDDTIIIVDENTYLKLIKEKTGTLVELYEKGIKVQLAVYNIENQEILYYDLCSDNGIYTKEKNNFIVQNVKPIRYDIDDFVIHKNNNEEKRNSYNIVKASPTFSLLQSKVLNFSDGSYYHYLYGYQSQSEHREQSWEFKAQTAISVIAAILGNVLKPGIVTKVISTFAVIGGYILSKETVSSWVIDYFWVYKFKRTTPAPVEFICPHRASFVYKKITKVETSSSEAIYETTYEQSDWEIFCVRDDILNEPGLYY